MDARAIAEEIRRRFRDRPSEPNAVLFAIELAVAEERPGTHTRIELERELLHLVWPSALA